jgi:hypothetical protein
MRRGWLILGHRAHHIYFLLAGASGSQSRADAEGRPAMGHFITESSILSLDHLSYSKLLPKEINE